VPQGGYAAPMRPLALLVGSLWCLLALPGCTCAAWHWDPPSPLMAAIQNNNVDAVRAIVDRHGEDLDAERLHRHAMYGDLDFLSETPLTLAVGSPEMIRILVRGGAAVDGRMQQGRTPLGLAVDYGRPESVEALLELGADPTVPDFLSAKHTVYDAAMLSPDERVRRLMRSWAERRGAGSGG
jgi:hypothetical protein